MQTTLRDALSATILFDVFNRHADCVHMTNIAQTLNVLHSLIQTDGEKMWRTPTYWAYMLYKPHRGGRALRTVLECARREMAGGGMLPLVSASASRDGDRAFVTMTNLQMAEPVEVTVRVGEGRLDGAQGRMLRADAANALNSAEEPDRVGLLDVTVRAAEGALICELPPMSCLAVKAGLY